MRFIKQFVVYVVLVAIGVVSGIIVSVFASFIATIPLFPSLEFWVAIARIVGGFGGGIALGFIAYRIYLDYRGADINLIIDEEWLIKRELTLENDQRNDFAIEIPMFFINNGSKSGVLAEMWVEGSCDSYGNVFNESIYQLRTGYLESKGIHRELFSFITKTKYFAEFEFDSLEEPRRFPRETQELISFPLTIDEKASIGFSLRLEYYCLSGKMVLKENERLSLEVQLKFKTIQKGKIETKEEKLEVIRIIKYA